MPSVTSCFLMRCGVRGRCPGAQASPRWPQLLIAGPGTWRKLGRWGVGTRGSLKRGLMGAASLQAWQRGSLLGMPGGSQEGEDRPRSSCQAAPRSP